jgi:hypothetical protein
VQLKHVNETGNSTSHAAKAAEPFVLEEWIKRLIKWVLDDQVRHSICSDLLPSN